MKSYKEVITEAKAILEAAPINEGVDWGLIPKGAKEFPSALASSLGVFKPDEKSAKKALGMWKIKNANDMEEFSRIVKTQAMNQLGSKGKANVGELLELMWDIIDQ